MRFTISFFNPFAHTIGIYFNNKSSFAQCANVPVHPKKTRKDEATEEEMKVATQLKTEVMPIKQPAVKLRSRKWESGVSGSSYSSINKFP